MTQHIIDTDELEKLLSAVTIDTFAGEPYVTGLTEIYALIANSPQADDTYGQDFHLDYTCKRFRRLLNVMGMSDPSNGKDHVLMGMLFTLLGTICSKLEKPQVDDVRKDAERLDWIEKKFCGLSDSERYLPFRLSWGKGNNKTLREAIDKARE